MAGAISKRQQARNEKQLQELLQTVPGNSMCADCHARNPGMRPTHRELHAVRYTVLTEVSKRGHHGVYVQWPDNSSLPNKEANPGHSSACSSV